MSLAHDRMSPFHAENTEAVSDEVVLNWSPCTINDKVEPVISYNSVWLKICHRAQCSKVGAKVKINAFKF